MRPTCRRRGARRSSPPRRDSPARRKAILSSDADFLRAWTIFEAYGKARGQGLPQVLSELGLFGAKRAGTVPRREITKAACALAHAARLQVSPLRFVDPLVGALAAPKGLTVPPVRSFPTDEQALSEALRVSADH